MRFDDAVMRERLPGREIVHLEVTGSTMQDAAALARAGCGHGTIVVADEQTAGHGRFHRKWHSERGTGLYLSIVLRLALPTASVPSITLALGLATEDALAAECGVACDLRWPNDVMIGGRKCAGILSQQETGAFIAGIGINVNQREFPPDVATIATSLRIESGREQSRERVLVALVEAIDRYIALLRDSGRSAIRDLFYERSSYARGKRVVVELPDGEIEGVTDGLDDYGFLYVRKDDGARELILAGGVRPAAQR